MTNSSTPRAIIAGKAVYEAQKSRKLAALGEKPAYGFPSEDLCAWQIAESRRGIIEAEIVESLYGYSVRYASGIYNFGLIASSRAREVDGSIESAIAYAKRWQSADPERRFVTARLEKVAA